MPFRVALLAEGVDRNTLAVRFGLEVGTSPSSRRAWIEIPYRLSLLSKDHQVALLAEGVDRNSFFKENCAGQSESPSSRRAWIEIR